MVRSRSEVGRIKVFTCMLKVRTMSDTIRNSNFLLHVNVLIVYPYSCLTLDPLSYIDSKRNSSRCGECFFLFV